MAYAMTNQSHQSDRIHPDEHTRHLSNAAYQAAIERAAIQETGESTEEIEARTMTTRDKIKWWLESRRSRYVSSTIAKAIGATKDEVDVACADLVRDKEIIGHEQNGVILYYAKGVE